MIANDEERVGRVLALFVAPAVQSLASLGDVAYVHAKRERHRLAEELELELAAHGCEPGRALGARFVQALREAGYELVTAATRNAECPSCGERISETRVSR